MVDNPCESCPMCQHELSLHRVDEQAHTEEYHCPNCKLNWERKWDHKRSQWLWSHLQELTESSSSRVTCPSCGKDIGFTRSVSALGTAASFYCGDCKQEIWQEEEPCPKR